MNKRAILAACDHTLLDRCAGEADIARIVDEGIKYGTASVCIPPCYVKFAKAYSKGRIPICTVIGFPNGYSSTEAKVFEAGRAVLDGADEIDMVINLGKVKDGKFDAVLEEINAVKAAAGEKILKVIIETCCLTEGEKVELCKTVSESRADFIKTSTGFGTHGATLDDVKLMAKNMKNGKKIKAAGGISSLEDADAFLSAGAARLGTSRIVKLVKNEEADGY
ncbi:MAG: deoxyribose-phosphate aldolase [Clostridia bacterium]|nr:deoxyribose-phosphate aldolase [Clostridia bacterium]